MEYNNQIIFEPFRLDLTNQCLWRASQAIKLRPKAFAVLNYLLGRPGQLVTKEELLNAVWPETFVGEAVLKVTIRQLREALSDDPKAPRFIETAHRRGYRFIGQTAAGQPPQATSQYAAHGPATVAGGRRATCPAARVVGRDEALAQMQGWLERMLDGERQVVFVTGEAGIGKTTLVETFAQDIAAARGVRVGWGQCLEQYGTSEAYLPVLEAMGRLCREAPQGVEVLRAHAPMWLLQMPSLVSAAERESLSREVFGATRERMLREMGQALEAWTADTPLVLILEDLHWSDYSTLDLISYLARQRQATRLMLIGTYRSAELIVSGHPLKAVKRELLAKRQCDELPLEYLSEAAVAEYLAKRFPAHRFPAALAALVHERTEGSPLFLVNVVAYLLAERVIAESERGWELAVALDEFELGVPDSIKQLIDKQIDHLDADAQQTLEAASVAGAEFSLLALMAGLGEERAAVEARCEELARRRQFIHDCGVQELPNGETVARYGFIHALYQGVLYGRLSPSRRIQLHRRIGERGEALYGERAREIAAELAMHFERSADYQRAAKYLQQAADNSIRRFAYREAVRLARQGLELTERLPATTERAAQELYLQLTLGVPLVATEGYAAAAVGRVYLRARELCRQVGEPANVSEALWGLWTFYLLRAALQTARQIAEEFLRLADRPAGAWLALRGHWALQITCMHLGEFTPAMAHFEKALSLYDPERHLDDAFLYGLNPGVAMPCFAAWALWFIGRADEAAMRMQQALTLARQFYEPHSLAHALIFAAIFHQLRREPHSAQEHAEAAMAVASEHGLIMYQAMAMVLRGWALIEPGGEGEAVELMRQGLATLQATGTELVRPHFLALLAEALAHDGQTEAALAVLEEALAAAHSTGECYYQSELYRVKGEILIKKAVRRGLSRAAPGGKTSIETEPPAETQAEACFRESIKIAQRQKAKSWELRAATSLARLYQGRGRREQARHLLAQTYDRLAAGGVTVEMRETKALLDEWS